MVSAHLPECILEQQFLHSAALRTLYIFFLWVAKKRSMCCWCESNGKVSACVSQTCPCALQAKGNSIELTAVELYGRWGTWFLTLSADSSRDEDSKAVEINVAVEEGGCAGQRACSGHGVCLRNSQLDWFCRCEPGWFGHVCEVCLSSQTVWLEGSLLELSLQGCTCALHITQPHVHVDC
jgi:hypothetical protein